MKKDRILKFPSDEVKEDIFAIFTEALKKKKAAEDLNIEIDVLRSKQKLLLAEANKGRHDGWEEIYKIFPETKDESWSLDRENGCLVYRSEKSSSNLGAVIIGPNGEEIDIDPNNLPEDMPEELKNMIRMAHRHIQNSDNDD